MMTAMDLQTSVRSPRTTKFKKQLIAMVVGLSLAVLPALVVSSPAAAAGVKLTASKTKSIKTTGETIKVAGSGFKNGGLFVALCNLNAAPGGACDMVNFKQVQAKSGKFKTAITVKSKFTGGDGSKVDCMKVPCALQTSKVGAGADASQTATVKLTFKKPVPKAKASMSVKAAAGKAKVKFATVIKAKGVKAKYVTGKVTIKLGNKTLKTIKVKNGKAAVTLKKQKRGTKKYSLIYSGNSKVAAKKLTKKVKIK